MREYYPFVIPIVFCIDKADALEEAVLEFYSYEDNRDNYEIVDYEIQEYLGSYIVILTVVGSVMI